MMPSCRFTVAARHPAPRLSILMLALTNRSQFRDVVLSQLQEQAFGQPVEILVLEDDGQTPSGTKRNEVRRHARGTYVAFVDDDDHVADDYVQQLLTAARYGPDVITFDLLQTNHALQTHVRWSYRLQNRDAIALGAGQPVRMMANHLCAWRRTLAGSVAFSPIGYNDDRFWYHPLIASGLPRISRHIPQVLYHYDFRPQVTANQQPASRDRTIDWAQGGVDCYRYHGQLVVACQGRYHTPAGETLTVRLPDDSVQLVPRDQLQWVCCTHFR